MLLIDPIKAGDGDLWFHLSGGRYLFARGAIPTDSYFSFLIPPRTWVNYAWGFQALVYQVHAVAGYYGLLALRAAVFAGLAALVCQFLLGRGAGKPGTVGWRAAIAIVALAALLPRFLTIRPHLFTCLLMAAFLVILEDRPNRLAWLPILSVVWCNLHGVSYPVMLLILGSYAIERPTRTVLAAAGISAAALAANPFGLELLGTPWRSMSHFAHTISELTPPTLADLTAFTYPNLVLFAAAAAAVAGLARRRVRFSHLLLFAGGCVLLARGRRFWFELVLLSLPLLRAAVPEAAGWRALKRAPQLAAWVAAFVLVMVPVGTSAGAFTARRGAHPFSTRHLPEGVCAFLRQAGTGGTVFNSANSGGYLRWRLEPDYLIFMDVEMYFTDEDFETSGLAFRSPDVLRQVIERHRPSFISAPLRERSFPELIAAFPDYRPVFFDDAEVLYVDAARHPGLAGRYRLRALRPGRLHEVGKQAHDALLSPERLESVIVELERLLSVHPSGGSTNYALGKIRYAQGDYAGALAHADAMIRSFPEYGRGRRLRHAALTALGRGNEEEK